MVRSSLLAILLALHAPVAAQDDPRLQQNSDLKRCTPRVIKHASARKDVKVSPRKDEKPSRYPPVILFQILKSGEVVNARVKRSSGFTNIDNYALDSVRGVKYNSRPGCGVIESEAVVNIHFLSTPDRPL